MPTLRKTDLYRSHLASIDRWEPYLRSESGLPGPRGNLELAHVVAEMGSLTQFNRWLAEDAIYLSADTPDMFLAFCGVIGLGVVIARAGEDPSATEYWSCLRAYASDRRWRMREAVAMALQRVGDADMGMLYAGVDRWRFGNWLEKRAVVAGLAEPRLLADETHLLHSLAIIDEITASILTSAERGASDARVLRQCLGYAWSVLVAASPEIGKPVMERWLAVDDPDIRWIMKENLKKKRIADFFTPI